MEFKQRMKQAYVGYLKATAPNYLAANGGPEGIKMMSVSDKTHSGLLRCIRMLVKWEGGVATNTPTQGRLIGGKWVPGSGRKGKADCSIHYCGSGMEIEAKVGKDTQRDEQQKEEKRMEAVGIPYRLVRSMEQFIPIWDAFKVRAELKQAVLLRHFNEGPTK